MADVGEIATNQLTEITECPICICEFNDPRMLPCIHTFCFDCLKRTSEEAQLKPGDTMPCPLCRKEFIVPADGINGVQKNFFMGSLVRLNTTLQTGRGNNISDTHNVKNEDCTYDGSGVRVDHSQKLSTLPQRVNYGSDTMSENESDSMSESEPSSSVKYCTRHIKKRLDYYCSDCKKLVCVSCFVESHKSHDCKDVATVEDEFRQTIEKKSWTISNYADEMLSIRKITEERKAEFLQEIQEKEDRIHKRNLELKEMIDLSTNSLLDELSLIKSTHLKAMEMEMEEIERRCTIYRNFEFYCDELISHGSASDICDSLEKVIVRANDFKRSHEEFLGGPRRAVEVSFETTDIKETPQKFNTNVVGQIKVKTETISWSENCAVVVGFYNGASMTKDVIKINLRRSNEVSAQEHIPTKMTFETFVAVYCNTIYVTGAGTNKDEIWKYNMASGWMKCASLVQGRRRHCAAFIDEELYICGGYTDSNKSVLDSVEAYDAVTDRSSTVGKLFHRVRSSGNCVPYKSSLFIFGGSDEEDKEVNHVQVYNTKENTCSLLSRPMPHPYMLMRAAVWETSVILVGPNTCFIFNLETEKWQEREKFKTDVVHFGLVLEDERIFVIGGGTYETEIDGRTTRKCRDDVRSVSLQSVIKKKPIEWKIHATLPKPSFVQACAKLGFTV